ncbi:MAG: WYL domain-containing protein [Bacteroidales bacterium]|nr:WYL domain-containing protein [Bacteroidales bacterium]
MVSELVDKYVFLLQTFVEAGGRGLDLGEISSRWESRYGEAYPRRTFVNHRRAIEEIFGIVIKCDRSTNRYLIDSAESAVDKREAMEYLVNTFTVNSLLTLGKQRLSGRVAVEDIPSGQKYLTAVMQAMLDNRELVIGYRKYMSDETEQRTICPYAVKEFEKRWYIVALSKEQNGLRTYAMDRITSLAITEDSFRMPAGFNVDEVFESSYGIWLPDDEKPVLVRLKATKREASYLKDLPLHHSQITEEETPDHTVFALRVIPNRNFIMELCKRGDGLEVLQPPALREEVKQQLKKAYSLYG